MADVKFVVTVDDKGFTQKIQNFDQAIEGLGKSAGRTGTSFGSLWQQVGLGNIVANAAMAGIRGLKNELASVVEASMEQESASRALKSSLELTGREVEWNAKHYEEYAGALQKATVYADEEILAAQTLMLQLTSLDRNGIDRATKGAIGLASTLRIDLNSAAMMVTKAMEGNFQALQRYGIKVDENLSLEEKRIQLLDRLEKMYGRATDETETFEGKTKKLSQAWGEFKETLGGVVTNSGLLKKVLEGLTESLNQLAAKSEAIPEKMSFWQTLASGIGGQIGIITQAAASTAKWSDATNVLADNWRQASNLLLTTKSEAIDPLPESIEVVRRKLIETVKTVGDARAAFKEWSEAALDAITIADLPEIDVGGFVSSIFPGEEEVKSEILQPFIDAALGAEQSATRASSAWDTALQAMTAGLVTFGNANATIWGNIGKVFGNFIKSAISGIEALMLKEIIESKTAVAGNQAKAQSGSLASIFSSIPWPFSLVAAAGSFALVNALFSKVFKFEKGGFADRPIIAEIGHGPEYVLPEARLEKLVERTVERERTTVAGPRSVNVNLSLSFQAFDESTIDRLAPLLARKLQRQLELGVA